MEQLTQDLKAKARAFGFSMVGVIEARPGRRLDAYLRWVENEMHGKMGYLARPDRLARRRDLEVILPAVQTMVCVGFDYHTQRVPENIASDPSRGRISNYAWGVDYHDVMTPRLNELGEWLMTTAAEQGISAEVQNKVYVDTGAILERDHGETAGLGFTGKNTMLIAPQHGSWFFLGELLTTLPLTPDPPAPQMPTCGRCTRCLTACPTNAFPEPYVLDARRCISYLTIELKGWVPREFRPLMGNWIYGCDICQDVCPFNRFADDWGEYVFRAERWETAVPRLLDLLALTEEAFDARYANSPIKRIKWARFMRNVCIAAGNWGDPRLVEPLVHLLSASNPLVRGHAAWALGRIEDTTAKQYLKEKLPQETDAQVQEEILLAIKKRAIAKDDDS